MASPSEIRSVFTVDLKPFALGLQTALGMGRAFGKQLQPVLNLKVEPDTGVFNAQLNALEKDVQAYMKSLLETGGALDIVGKETNELEKNTDKADTSVRKGTQSLGRMKRQALEIFGALSFVSMSLVDVASNFGGSDQKLQKLSGSMSKGISAGFGLASMMTILGIATGGTAVAIGAVVAIGVSLLSFLDNSEEKAKRAQKAMEGFAAGLRGASVQQLLAYRQEIIAAAAASKKRAEEIEKQLDSGQLLNARMAGVLRKRLADEEAFGQMNSEMARKIEEQITGMQMTEAEVRTRIQELEAQAVADKYDKLEAEAVADFTKEKQRINESIATATTKARAMEALEQSLAARIREIRDQEAKEHDQRVEQAMARYREYEDMLRRLDKETVDASRDAQKARALATAQSARDRIAIEELYALNAIKTEESVALAAATTEEEKTAILRKFSALREKLRQESSLKFQEAEKQDLEKMKRAQEEQRRQWMETHKFALTMIDGITRGVQVSLEQILTGTQLTSQTLIAQRQNDYRLFLLDQEKRRADLQQQLKDKTVTSEEYYLRVQQLDLDQRHREEENAAFRKQLEEERRGFVLQSWLTTRDFAVRALLDIGQEELKNFLISLARHEATETAKAASTGTRYTAETAALVAATEVQGAVALTSLATMTAATVAAMEVISAAAATSATLVSISTLGGAAIAGGAGVLAAIGLVKAGISIPGFEQGGKVEKGQVGFFEGRGVEYIVPKKTFPDIAQSEMIPQLILAQQRYLQTNAGAKSGGGEKTFDMARFERAIARLERLEFVIEGRSLRTVDRKQKEYDDRIGLS